MSDKIKKIQKEIIPVLENHGVKKASVFGSFARGENKKSSDIDILVEFEGGKTLLDLVGLEMELEKKLGRKVDLITYNSISPLLRKSILDSEVKIYGGEE